MKAVVLAVLAAASVAHAGEQPDVIATQPLALVGRGVGLSYEHQVRPRWSAVALAGFRATAGGDYTSRTVVAGGELRWWPYHPLRGLHVAVHASVAHTGLHDDVMDRDAGSAWALTERLDAGYRLIAWQRVTLTPTLGLALREDVDRTGRLATTARPTIAIGFEIGWRLR